MKRWLAIAFVLSMIPLTICLTYATADQPEAASITEPEPSPHFVIVEDRGQDIIMSSEGPTYTAISIQGGDWSIEIDWSDGVVGIFGDQDRYTDAAKVFFEACFPEAAYSIVRHNPTLIQRLIDDGAITITPRVQETTP